MGVGGAIIGGSLISGILGGKSAEKQSEAVEESSEAAIAEQRRQFDIIMNMMAPYQALGESALPELSALLGLGDISYETTKEVSPEYLKGGFAESSGVVGDLAKAARLKAYQESEKLKKTKTIKAAPGIPEERLRSRPGYQFRLAEGAKTVEAGQAARSGLLTGRAGKELSRYGQDYASAEYDKEVRRLMDVINIGRGSATTGAGAASATGTNISNIITGAGQAQAGIYGQQYQSMNNAIQGGIQNYMTYKLFQDAF
jgi:hypothetical protein